MKQPWNIHSLYDIIMIRPNIASDNGAVNTKNGQEKAAHGGLAAKPHPLGDRAPDAGGAFRAKYRIANSPTMVLWGWTPEHIGWLHVPDATENA